MTDLRGAIQRRATEVTEPVITSSWFDASIKDTIVEVEPYRYTDRYGDKYEVWRFYGNGGLITAEGYKVKKDGDTFARRQVILMPCPANVREALGR